MRLGNTTKGLTIGSHRLLIIHVSNGYFWFRILGYGLRLANRNKHEPLFSERNGYTKVLRIGKYSIKTLMP